MGQERGWFPFSPADPSSVGSEDLSAVYFKGLEIARGWGQWREDRKGTFHSTSGISLHGTGWSISQEHRATLEAVLKILGRNKFSRTQPNNFKFQILIVRHPEFDLPGPSWFATPAWTWHKSFTFLLILLPLLLLLLPLLWLIHTLLFVQE